MTNQQRNVVWLVGIIIVIAFVWWGMRNRQSPETSLKESVKVGAVIGLSGSHAYPGGEALKGINLAIEEINTASPLGIELIVEDSEAQPNLSVNAAQKLITQDGAKYLITFSGASSAQAVAPVANENKVIQMELICYAPGCHTQDDFLFRVSGSATGEPYFTAQEVMQRGFDRVAVIYMQNDLGETMNKFFSERFEELGGEVVHRDFFTQDERNFQTILTKLGAQTEAKAIVIFSYGEVADFLKQKAEMDLNLPVYAFETAKDPEVVRAAGTEAVEGVLFSYPGNTRTKAHELFVQKFKDRHGAEPTIGALKGYDAMKLLHAAIYKCSDRADTACVKENLENTRNYEGASNTISFDEFGDVIEERFHTEVFRNGTWEIAN